MSIDDQVVLDALVAAYLEVKDEIDGSVLVDDKDDNSVWGKLRLSLLGHTLFSKGRHVFAGHHQLQLHPLLVSSHIKGPLKRRGPEGTLRWLHEIFAIDTFVSRQCAELLGVKLSHELLFANGVRLVPFDDMRASTHADGLKYFYDVPRPFIRWEPRDVVGMIKTVDTKFSTDHKKLTTDYSAFNEVALGITVATDVAPVVGSCWSEFENTDYADAEFHFMHTPPRYEGRPPGYQTVELGEAQTIWINRFLSLNGPAKKICVIAAGRLNSARRRMGPVDSAIDLATALEALLVTGDERKTEIAYRLKLRASLLLGGGYEDRLSISKSIGKLYDLRSGGVHGTISGSQTAKEQAVVDWAEGACQQLLRLVVEAGRSPDWRKLELTGDVTFAFS